MRQATRLLEDQQLSRWAAAPDGRPLAYGLGWTVSHNAAGRLRVGHGGFIPGYRASYLRDVGDPTWSVLVMTNQQAVDPGPLAATVAGLFARDAA